MEDLGGRGSTPERSGSKRWCELGERRASPERKRFAQLLRRLSHAPGRERVSSFLHERLEAVDIELAPGNGEHVPVRASQQDAVLSIVPSLRGRLVLEPAAQLRDQCVNALRRA